ELAASVLKLDAGLLRLLAENSLRPAFRAWAKSLRGLDFDHWLRGQCPVCGGAPLLSEIQGKEGARRLRCGMCGSGWYYPRLRCAFCDNKDHHQLGYITVEGEEAKYSVQTCAVCRNYLKVVVTFDPIPVDMLVVENLATLHLDVIAEKRGYIRPALTADAITQRREDTKSHEAV
ncbi:MAG: formate dehydrogenase accessory protein FdhE, partial [Anaerolineales bacterium]